MTTELKLRRTDSRSVALLDSSGVPYGVDNFHPLAVNTDRVYVEDLLTSACVLTGWVGYDGGVSVTADSKYLFDSNRSTILTYAGVTNPKTITIIFNQVIVSDVIGLYAYGGGTFSNVKVEIVTGNDILTTMYDDSTNNTAVTSKTIQFTAAVGFRGLKITFATTSDVSISGIIIQKVSSNMSRIHGYDVNNVDVDEVQIIKNKLLVSAKKYTHDIAMGYAPNHASFNKVGYTPTVSTSDTDVWSAAGAYVFPSAAMGMEVISSDNTKDIGTSIFNGTSTSGSVTSLIDTGKNFLGGTAAAVGDCVILDKSGTTPEWGYITAVATTELTVAGGFSSGGTGSGRAYYVIDKSAYTGAQVIKFEYLTSAFAQKSEICILNGTSAVATVNTDIYRINSFRIIAAGTDGKPTGNLSLRHTSDTPVYSYMTAGFTRARNSVYTVPAGKQLIIVMFGGFFGTTNANNYARIISRSTVEPSTGFITPGIFYLQSELIASQSGWVYDYDMPSVIPAGADIKVSVIGTAAGVCQSQMRGFLETL